MNEIENPAHSQWTNKSLQKAHYMKISLSDIVLLVIGRRQSFIRSFLSKDQQISLKYYFELLCGNDIAIVCWAGIKNSVANSTTIY